MAETKALICRRCDLPVRNAEDGRNIFEHMHYVCFHYEFEHGEQDIDFDCGVTGCPSGLTPPLASSPAVDHGLAYIMNALRDPY